MSLSSFLRFFRPSPSRTHFKKDRRDKVRPGFRPQILVLEDRCLMTVYTPLLPMTGNNQNDPKGLNSVVYTPEGDPGFDKNNLPSAKLVTIENNSSSVVYPIFYGANSTEDKTAGTVVRIALDNPGSGYNTTNNPALWPKVKITNLTRNPTNAASASVKVSGEGTLYGLELLDGGAGYQKGDQLKVEFDDSANGNKGSGGSATAFVSQYDINYALYNPKDGKNQTYRGYIGEKDANGQYALGLLPGHQATVQVPIAFWDGGRLYFATNGQVPLSSANDPGNPLQNNTEWFFDPAKPSYLVTATTQDTSPLYGANFADPVTHYANPNAAVLWYHDPVKAHDFGFGTPAQLTEMTFRDPKQFHIAPDMTARELDTIINYDVSYVDNLSMPASMQGTNVPLRGGPPNAPKLPPGQFAWLGSDMSVTEMQKYISEFTTVNLTPQAGVSGPNGLGTYFGGLGYDQYYMPPDNNPSGGIRIIRNLDNTPVQIFVGVTGALHNGSSITISGITGQTDLNGTWVIDKVESSLTETNFFLKGATGNGVLSSGGSYATPTVGVHIQKLPAGYQVIADSGNQNVQSGFDGTRFSLESGGIKAGVETLGTGVSVKDSPNITGVSASQAALLAPGMLWTPVNTVGPNPQPYFPNGTSIKEIIQGTPGQNDATIVMTNKANFARSGQSWTFSGSQYISDTGKIVANTDTITGLDPKVGIYLRPGMLVTGTNVPPGAFISSSPDSISADFKTIKLTKSIGAIEANGPFAFTGAPYSYVVRKLIDVWYSWADYYVRQLNNPGPNQAPSGIFQGTTTANTGRGDDNSLLLKVTDSAFDMSKLRVGDVVTATNGALTPNSSDDPSLNYTITKIDTIARTVHLSLPVAVTAATVATFSFAPPKFIVRSEDAPAAPGTAGTIPYTLDFATGTTEQKDAALKFARTVYDVMQTFSLLLDPETLLSRSALLLRYSIGGNVGSFKENDDLFFKLTGRHTLLPHERTHVQLRDEIKSILRGVFDFLDPSVSDPANWYPDPAKPTPGATLDAGTGVKPIDFGVYNLNPYVWFVHTQLKMSGYGFSLDDDIANTTANTDTLLVAFGGNAYTAPIDTTKTPSDPPAPDLVNLEAYTGGAKFGTQQDQGYIQGTNTRVDNNKGETRISGLKLETVLQLVASTNPSDPIGAYITGLGLPPGVTVYNYAGENPKEGKNLSWASFKTPDNWTPPADDQPITQFTFSGHTTKVPKGVTPGVTGAAPGTMVTITGSGFTGVLGASFNGIPGTLISGPITGITNPNGGTVTISTGNTQGLVNGDTVTINGIIGQKSLNRQWVVTNLVANTSFQLTGSSGNGVASSAGSWVVGTDSSLKVIVPSFTPNSNGTTFPGPTGKVAVRTPAGTNYSSTFFTIGNPATPTFSGIGQPGSATANGSLKSTVTLFGNGFTGTSSVTFNGSATPIDTFSTNPTGTELKITIPVDASGSGTFTITVGGANYTSTGYTFTVNLPVIAASNPFSPASGPIGTTLTIKGTGFTGADDPDTGGVTINGTAATHVTVVDDTTLTVRVAPGTTSGQVVVTTSAGSGNSGSNSFTISAFQTPTITSANPNQGAAGALIQLKGTNFTGVNQTGGGITFGGVSATSLKVVDDQTITVTVPDGVTVGSAPIVVTNPGALNSAPFAFTVIAPAKPVITGFSPGFGSAGTSVTITGTGFTKSTLVQFNSTSASFVIQDDTTIIATVPNGATTGLISVKDDLGTGTSATSFVVGVQPAISSFSPDKGNVGTVVTIKGSGFTGVTHVKFNGKDATTFKVTDDATITATVPTGATTGRITVSNSGGNAATSATNFTVTTAVKPAITSFTPASGAPGTSVTITGTGFTGTTAVAFNGVAASVFTVQSDTSIKVTVPALATTGLLTVTNSAGTGSSKTSFIVESPNAPAFITVSAGSPQTSAINGAFDSLLKAKVTDSSNTPLKGISVTFTAPASGASGKFAGGLTTVTVTTDANGIATSPVFTANGTIGAYVVKANVTPGLATPASFALTNLSANQAYISELFQAYLGRNGAVSELNHWVGILTTSGRLTVINGIRRSTEASTRLVNSITTKLINGTGTAQSTWVNKLVGGATVEDVIGDIAASAEFAKRAKALYPADNANTAFAKAAVFLLLNHQADAATVTNLVNRITRVGLKVTVQGIVGAPEFRTGAVRTFFGDPTLNPLPYQPFFNNLLQRKAAPSPTDIANWVGSAKDLMSIQADFAATDEFFKLATR